MASSGHERHHERGRDQHRPRQDQLGRRLPAAGRPDRASSTPGSTAATAVPASDPDDDTRAGHHDVLPQRGRRAGQPPVSRRRCPASRPARPARADAGARRRTAAARRPPGTLPAGRSTCPSAAATGAGVGVELVELVGAGRPSRRGRARRASAGRHVGPAPSRTPSHHSVGSPEQPARHQGRHHAGRRRGGSRRAVLHGPDVGDRGHDLELGRDPQHARVNVSPTHERRVGREVVAEADGDDPGSAGVGSAKTTTGASSGTHHEASRRRASSPSARRSVTGGRRRASSDCRTRRARTPTTGCRRARPSRRSGRPESPADDDERAVGVDQQQLDRWPGRPRRRTTVREPAAVGQRCTDGSSHGRDTAACAASTSAAEQVLAVTGEARSRSTSAGRSSRKVSARCTASPARPRTATTGWRARAACPRAARREGRSRGHRRP